MNFDVSTINVWEVEERNGVDFNLLHFPAIWLGFGNSCLRRPTIALLLHRISHVAHCVYILTKALLLFTLLPKMAYMWLMVGGMEACTRVTYIAKSNNGSMEMTNQTSWSRSCTYVEGGWWNETLLLWISLSFIWITWGHGYIYIYFFFFFHGHWCVHFLGSCFFGMPSFLFFLIAHASFEGY